MSTHFEGRPSESPYVEIVWRGHVEHDESPVCPADVRWNLLFTKYGKSIRVSAEGPPTKSVLKNLHQGAEFLVIKFKLGVYMPYLPTSDLVDSETVLPEAASASFYFNGFSWPLPDFDNVESFVDRLVRHDLLVVDPVVNAVLRDQTPVLSSRTVRRRFLYATGLTPKAIQQIERAQQAASLLAQGASILDATYQTGYADQPHLTRSLRRYYGLTPTQIARGNLEEAVELTA